MCAGSIASVSSLMTLAAGALGDLVIARRDPQRVRVPSGREVERVPESVLRFRQIFRNKPRRRVAVVADGNGAMTRARPRIEVILHDVAVGARPGIVGEIRVALRVDEGVTSRCRPERRRTTPASRIARLPATPPRLSYNPGAPLCLFLDEPHRHFTNQHDAGRKARPVPAELPPCRRVGRNRARFRTRDRAERADRVGAQRPHDLHVVGLVERREVLGRQCRGRRRSAPTAASPLP